MTTATTNGIKVSVEPKFEGFSTQLNKFVFSYKVIIENKGNETVQLLRRHWFIFDSTGSKNEVEGEGVIGKQPILAPNQMHEYTSWSPIYTEIGTMHGTFLMKRLSDNHQFKVTVPQFQFITPYRLS
jgi:ApaG protein